MADSKKTTDEEPAVNPDEEIKDLDQSGEKQIEDAEIVEEDASADTVADDPEPEELTETVEDDPATDAEPAEADTPEQPEAPAVQKTGGGFFSTLLGGVVAAGIGFGAAYFVLPDLLKSSGGDSEVSQSIALQGEQIEKLSTGLEGLTQTVTDQSANTQIADQIAKMNEALTDQISGLSGDLDSMRTQFSTLDERLLEIEKRPISQGGDVTGAVQAYERELEAMRSDLEAQRTQNEEMSASINSVADKARAEIDAARARASELETHAALVRLEAALENGGSFASALKDIDGAEIPTALASVAETGVPSLSQLKASFPNLAREALSVSLRDAAGDSSTDKLGAFLRSSLGARSLAPRGGDDPDAVLSRAEAALSEGRLQDTLAEIKNLPQSGQDILSDWESSVTSRIEAVEALKSLQDSLNLN